MLNCVLRISDSTLLSIPRISHYGVTLTLGNWYIVIFFIWTNVLGRGLVVSGVDGLIGMGWMDGEYAWGGDETKGGRWEGWCS